MYNTLAHGATLFYHLQVFNHLAHNDLSVFNDPRIAIFTEFQPKFFTLWCYAVQTLLFVLCVAHDLSRILAASNPVRKATMYIRDAFFVGLALPMALTVTISFWGLVSVDRELVFPTFLEPVLPPWLNHTLHTLVAILVLVELFAEPHVVPTLRVTLVLQATVLLSYVSVLLHEYFTSGRWLYPVFEFLNWPGRIALVLSIGVVSVATALACRLLVRKIWGSTRIFPKHRKA